MRVGDGVEAAGGQRLCDVSGYKLGCCARGHCQCASAGNALRHKINAGDSAHRTAGRIPCGEVADIAAQIQQQRPPGNQRCNRAANCVQCAGLARVHHAGYLRLGHGCVKAQLLCSCGGAGCAGLARGVQRCAQRRVHGAPACLPVRRAGARRDAVVRQVAR